MCNTLSVTELHDLELIVSSQLKSLIGTVCHKITALIDAYVRENLIQEIKHLHYMEQQIISANRLVDIFHHADTGAIIEQIHLMDRCNIWLSALLPLDTEQDPVGDPAIPFLRVWIEGANMDLYSMMLRLYCMSSIMNDEIIVK